MKKLLTQIKTILEKCLENSAYLTTTEFELLKLVAVPNHFMSQKKWHVELNDRNYQFEVLEGE